MWRWGLQRMSREVLFSLSNCNLRNKLPGNGRGHPLGWVWTIGIITFSDLKFCRRWIKFSGGNLPKKWIAIGFSTLVQDLVIWDTVRLLWFHPAHGLGGDACAMANCYTWPNCAISDAGLVASCGGKPISRTNGCQQACTWTTGLPSGDFETVAPPSEPPAMSERSPGLRIPWWSSGEYPGSAGKCSRTNDNSND